jgi:IS4 transposase
MSFDRGYLDFARLYRFTLSAAFFVTHTKENVVLQRRYSHPVDKSTGVRSDQTVVLTTSESARAYPDALRRISYVDAATNNHLVFLTNNFVLPALTIARIYQCRWQVGTKAVLAHHLFRGQGGAWGGQEGPAPRGNASAACRYLENGTESGRFRDSGIRRAPGAR